MNSNEIFNDIQDNQGGINKEQLVIGKTFRLVRKLISGGYSDIYHGVNLESNIDVIIKIESANIKNPMLFYEAKIYQYLHQEKQLTGAEAIWAERQQKQEKGVPKVYYCSSEGEYNVMIMDKLGPNLMDLFNICNTKFQVHTVCMIGKQVIQRIQFLHEKHFVHRDIKPENFCIGLGEKKEFIYIIDMGFAKKYIQEDGKHIPFQNEKGFTGTIRYASVNTHKQYEQSRRDDLESMMYMLLYFLKGALPWQNLKYNQVPPTKKEKMDKVYEKKANLAIETICKGIPEQFQKMLQYTQGLQFTEKPNYELYTNYFNEMIQNLEKKDDQMYDWKLAAQSLQQDFV